MMRGKRFCALLLCALRLLLTLGIEGTVFWLHGYRSKQSWRVFLLLNLATQLFVNVVFAGPYLNTYAATLALFGYLLVEGIVFGVEIAVCGKCMPEHGPQQARDCAALANFVSAVAGAGVGQLGRVAGTDGAGAPCPKGYDRHAAGPGPTAAERPLWPGTPWVGSLLPAHLRRTAARRLLAAPAKRRQRRRLRPAAGSLCRV